MRRIGLGLLAVLFAAAALVGLAQRVTARSKVSVGENTLVDKGGEIEAHNSPSLVRNPRVTNQVVTTDRVDRPTFSAKLDWSTDGGRVWKTTALPLPRGLDRPYAADAAFGPNGTLYVTYVNLEGPGNVPGNLWLVKSLDGGRTLSRPVRVAGALAFQARVAVDRADVVHVIWLQGRGTGLFELVGPPSPIVASRSTDGGRTFSTPVQVSDPRRQYVGAVTPIIDSNGRLVVLYEDFKNDRRDFQDLQGPPWDRPFALVVTRPVGDRAFSEGVQLESDVLLGHRFLVFTPEFPSLAAGPGNTLYVAWSDSRNGDDDVFLRRSDDGGLTWSSPKRVNDNPKHDGTSQYLPRVDVAPNGRVDVVFLDRRRDHKNVMTDATLAYSYDRGESFHNVRLSTRSFDSRVGPVAGPQFPVDFGSRLGVVSNNDRSLAAWTDTRLGSVDSGRQDIFATSYEVPPNPSGLSRVPVIVVLLLVALVCAALAAADWRKGREQA